MVCHCVHIGLTLHRDLRIAPESKPVLDGPEYLDEVRRLHVNQDVFRSAPSFEWEGVVDFCRRKKQ